MITELQQLGLNEKEAKVYLASLELGQSTVQEIAKKAGINRPTTYFIIEGLMKRGLMSSFHKGKKQYFVAADPNRFYAILDKSKKDIDEKKRILEKVLPQLESLNPGNKDRPVVRYYEGKEGLMTITEEFLKYAPEDTQMIYSVDKVKEILSKEDREELRSKRVGKGIKTEVIYTYKDGFLENTADGKRLKIPFDKFPINCDIAIYGDKIRIASLDKRLVGIIIEDKNIADTMRSIFRLAFEAAEKYDQILKEKK